MPDVLQVLPKQLTLSEGLQEISFMFYQACFFSL